MVSQSKVAQRTVNTIGTKYPKMAGRAKSAGKVVPFLRERIAKAVLHDGMSYRNAARHFGVALRTVQLWVGMVLKRPPRNTRRDTERENIRQKGNHSPVRITDGNDLRLFASYGPSS
jgi:hypothetical protein